MSEPHHHPKLTESSSHLGGFRSGERSRLFWVMVLTGVTMVGEFIGGLYADSLALLGDAFHMLTHFLSVGLSYVAILIATRPAPPDKTYRYWRVEVLATFVNALALLPVAGYVVYEAIQRLYEPREIRAGATLIVGAIGLSVNLASAMILHRHSKTDLNVRGAFLHMLSDTASSVGVLAAGGAVFFWGWTAADPLTAAGISVLIVVWSLSLLRSSSSILLESVPKHMNLEEIRGAMKSIDGVAEVHDLHVWTITSGMYALTAHVRLPDDLRVAETEEIHRRLGRMLDERYEIQHVTIQFEVGEGAEHRCDHEATETQSHRGNTE